MSATAPATAADARTMTGAEIVLRALKEQGVEVIFGYPGGAVLPLYDALFQQNAIRHILVRHEQAAVHAAEGYARSTGKVGVVLVTSGPGATNAVTGLVDALMDSIPVICLTGQVPTHLIGNDAFQEADTTGITRPATKHNYLVKDINRLAETVHEAFYVAKSGRPGPVVIDLPKDILIGKAPYRGPSSEPHRSYRPRTEPDPEQIRKAVALLKGARRWAVNQAAGRWEYFEPRFAAPDCRVGVLGLGMLGGRAAEKLVFGHLSTGAADDIAKVTDIARDMVMRYGMDESLGYIAYEAQRPQFLDVPGLASGGCPRSPETQARIDEAVRRIVMDAFERACAILQQHRALLERCARELLQRETLDEAQLRALTAELRPAAQAPAA